MRAYTAERLVTFFPYLLFSISAAGVAFTLYIHRIDLTITSLILVIPMILAGAVLVSTRNRFLNGEVTIALEYLPFGLLIFSGCLLFAISLCLLVIYPVRPLIYFLTSGLFAGMILLQILAKRPQWTDAVIVSEILIFSLSLIWGVTLKYPLYFLDTDTLVHLNLINTILETKHVEFALTNYQYYPLYHILAAQGVQVTGLSLPLALFVIMGIIWQIGILFSFLIFKNLTDSPQMALIGMLLFATSSQVFFYGTYPIARSLAFVLMMGWLFLIFYKAKQSRALLFLSLIIMVALILSHHLNVLFIIPLLLLLYFCQLTLSHHTRYRIIDPLFIFLFTICCTGYLLWIAATMASSTIPDALLGILRMDTALPADFTHGYGLTVLWGAIYYSFVLFLSFLGLKYIYSVVNLNKFKGALTFSLAGLFMLVLYVPGPVELLPLSDILLTRRFQLIFTPFVILLMVFGIQYLLRLGSEAGTSISQFSRLRANSTILAAAFVVILTCFSLVSTGNAQDNDSLPHTSMMDTPYFNYGELQSFSFLAGTARADQPLFSDYQTIRDVFDLGKFTDRNIITGGDINDLTSGYLILRIAELKRKSALTFSSDGKGRTTYRYTMESSMPENNIILNLASQDGIFTNGIVQIFKLR